LARLPAAIASTTTATVAAVTISAATPTAAAPTTASSSSAPAPAEAATAAPAASAPAAFTWGPCFVNNNVTAHEIVAVQSLDGAFGLLVAIDLDESEPAWLT
jgi:hypothetical protein